MPTDRELLERLFALMQGRSFIVGDEATIKAMVRSMKNPPMTMYHRVAMQLTVNDYRQLANVLTDIEHHLRDEHDSAAG